MAVDIALKVRLDQLRTELGKIPGLTEKEVQAAVRGAERQWKRLPAAAKRAADQSRRQMESVTRSVAGISPAAGAATAAVQGLGAALGPGIAAALGPLALAAGAVAALGGGAFVAANRMSTLVDQVELLGEHTGLSTRSVIAIRHAVASAGGDINKTREALASFNRVLGPQLAGKTGPEVDAMLRRTIQRIEGIREPAERAAERMRIFGTESALALAGLTGGGLERAAAQTNDLAERMERASSSSADMDRANASLQRSLDELAVVLGDKVAPAVVSATDAVTGLVDATTFLTDSAAGSAVQWFVTGGVLGDAVRNLWAYADGTRELARTTQQFDRDMAARAVRLRKQLELQRMAAGIDAAFAFEFTPRETPPEVIAAEKKANDAAIERARRNAKQVEKARAAVTLAIRQANFAQKVDFDEGRAEQIEEGRRRAEQLAAEEAQAHAAKMERLRQEREMVIAVQRARVEAAQAAISSAVEVANVVAQNSRASALLGLGEVTVNAGIAISRALAEGGPFAGPLLAKAVAGQLAPVIAAVKNVVGGGGPAMATATAGGGAGAAGGRGQVDYGFTLRDSGGNQIMIAEYRGEIYDAQSYDALRRPGSPLRDVSRRQRVQR